LPTSPSAIACATSVYGDEWRFVDRKGAPAAVRASGNPVSNSGDTLRLATLAGVGIWLAAGFLVRDHLGSGCCRNTGRTNFP